MKRCSLSIPFPNGCPPMDLLASSAIWPTSLCRSEVPHDRPTVAIRWPLRDAAASRPPCPAVGAGLAAVLAGARRAGHVSDPGPVRCPAELARPLAHRDSG